MALQSFLKLSPRLAQLAAGQARALRRGPPYTDIECVRVLQGGLRYLNLFAGSKSFQSGSPDGKFGAETEAAVKAFQKTVAFPSQPREWDGVIGAKTLLALDKSLPANSDAPSIITGPSDIVIYITGKADDTGFGGKELHSGDSAEFNDILGLPARPGFNLIRRGFGGSLDNSMAIPQVVSTILSHHSPGQGGKVILYGYSAGAKQVLEASLTLNLRNQYPSFAYFTGLFFFVDLLITVDAASGALSFLLPRRVAGCVRKNVNFYQTSASFGGSFGGPNSGMIGPNNSQPFIDNRNMDGELKSTSSTNRHYQINTIAHPRAMQLIRGELLRP